MTQDPPRSGTSRRRFLGSAATLGVAATAGCLGSAFGSSAEEIEPEEPSDPPEGTAGEFYYVLENQDEFDIEVDDLYWADSELEGESRDLILEYYSGAEPVEDTDEENESTTESPEENESTVDDGNGEPSITGLSSEDDVAGEDLDEEIDEDLDEEIDEDDPGNELRDPTRTSESEEEMGVIVDAYNQILVENGNTDSGMLVGDILDPFDGQAHGWGIKTESLEQYNAGEIDAMAMWMNVQRVYEEDIEAVEDD